MTLVTWIDSAAQDRYEAYIKKYADIAVEQMKKYNIPASITLAQGLLESGAGSSKLARESNNHFGIKCGTDWTGPTYAHYDDGIISCFRVYKNPEESYRDHSLFLQKKRYQKLFSLKKTDYKGWARGLKECGYATNPSYASILIDLIERYNLDKYDSKSSKGSKVQEVQEVQKVQGANDGNPFKVGRKYWHRVQPGESMASIAERYGMKIKKLYKWNFKEKDYVPAVGDLLRVKKKKG